MGTFFKVSFFESLLVCQVFYLVDDFLILALSLKVRHKSEDGSNDAANAAAPEEGVVYAASLFLIGLILTSYYYWSAKVQHYLAIRPLFKFQFQLNPTRLRLVTGFLAIWI